ncbi:MAG TPA: ArsC/Spx/MgsR family protein, partial [Burkholderiales bacterium]|nr:ArsC/Spx/MgsR family protein [Burkholderiales bacterium]
TRGTTWRRLSPQQQAGLDEARALRLMSEHPSLIKRPVLEHGASLLLGFDPQRYTKELAR